MRIGKQTKDIWSIARQLLGSLAGLSLLLLASCGGGGGGKDPDPIPIPKDEPEVSYVLTMTSPSTDLVDRAMPLAITVRPEAVDESPGPSVDTIFTVEMSLNAGGAWEPVTELRSTGSGKQRGIPQQTPLGLNTRITFFWDMESDLRLAGAESGLIEVAVRVMAEQARGAGTEVSNRITLQVDWSSESGCVVNAPSYQSGKTLTLEAGTEVNQQLLASGGDLPLTWSVDGILPGTLTLDPTGALRGVPDVTDSELFITIADSCSVGARKDFAFVRLRVLPPECDPLSFGTVLDLPEAKVGAEYDVDLRARLLSDGKGSLDWRLTSGKLPEGVTLTSLGRLQGFPKAGSAGLFPLTIEVSDECSSTQRDTERFVLLVGN